MSVRAMMWVACLAAGLAQAAYGDTIEITPFYGYSFGGEFEDAETGAGLNVRDSGCWGGMLDLRVSPLGSVEFYFSRQETELKSDESLFTSTKLFDLDVDYYHLGGTYILTDGQWQPFVVGTLGATHLDPEAPATDSSTWFSVGLGGGVRFFPTEHLGLYLAGRGLFTFVEGDAAFHSDSGAATVRINGDGFWQVQFQVGAIFAF